MPRYQLLINKHDAATNRLGEYMCNNIDFFDGLIDIILVLIDSPVFIKDGKVISAGAIGIYNYIENFKLKKPIYSEEPQQQYVPNKAIATPTQNKISSETPVLDAIRKLNEQEKENFDDAGSKVQQELHRRIKSKPLSRSNTNIDIDKVCTLRSRYADTQLDRDNDIKMMQSRFRK